MTVASWPGGAPLDGLDTNKHGSNPWRAEALKAEGRTVGALLDGCTPRTVRN
ncbi:MAG: hypothetical protein JO122_18270 [Acetobacteraceae bacterium]|nr:hypothetical protein [Acetobacteraceae bacterium]